MKVRSLREGDASQVLNLIEQCRPYVAPYNVYTYWILENDYSSACYIAEENDKIIGFISGIPSIDKQSIFIWQLCFHIDYRGRGIASSLLNSLINKVKELKFEKIELSISESNSTSQNLFKSYLHKNNLELAEKKISVFGNIIETVYEFILV